VKRQLSTGRVRRVSRVAHKLTLIQGSQMGFLKLFWGPLLHSHFGPITLDLTDRYSNGVGTLLPCSEHKNDRLSPPFLPRPSSPLDLITVYFISSFCALLLSFP